MAIDLGVSENAVVIPLKSERSNEIKQQVLGVLCSGKPI